MAVSRDGDCQDMKSPSLMFFRFLLEQLLKNGLYVETQVNGFPCRMIVDTGANVAIIRQDVVHQHNREILWTPPRVTLQTVTGDNIPVVGKMNIEIHFRSTLYNTSV